MGIELELLVLLILQTLGVTIFGRFEVETALWRRLLKWGLLIFGTLALYYPFGHLALLLPGAMLLAGSLVHVYVCRREGFHPIYATPRRRYYEYRGWTWIE